ncbi:MAG: aminotransferase class V-fold PLP-dependent enzyme [Candidatus Limnocylindrales bacterium]|jgi:L-cysteine/cystine lyase
MVGPFLPDDDKLPAIREALPATAAGIYLNTGSCGPLPRETVRAMAELEGIELRTGRADMDYWKDSAERMNEARAAVAAVLATEPRRMALTHATTEGMNVATWAIDWQAGDRVVTTSLEHAGALGPLWALRDRQGVDLAIADIGTGGDPAEVLAALDRAITPETRLVSISHVSWATGARLPIREIVELAHSRGALVAVDGAQAVGAIPVSVEEVGADFYAVPGQKWLLGPEGVGALYCAPSVLDRPRLTFAGYGSFESIDLAVEGKLWPDARRFEIAGYHQPSVLGLARSAAWLSMFVGLAWIHERVARLAGEAAAMLAEVPGVEVITPRDHMAGLVTFRIAGWKPGPALGELSKRTLAIARTIPPLDAIRISVGFFNTDHELRRFRDGVALVADHTPETIPHRPAIQVLRGGVD